MSNIINADFVAMWIRVGTPLIFAALGASICTQAGVNTAATGLTVFVLQIVTGEKGNSSSLQSFVFPEIDIPLIKDLPVLGDIISGHNLLTYLAILMVVAVWFLLYKTPLGLRMRAMGEAPEVAASVGQSVNRIQFLAIIFCGVLTSLGGGCTCLWDIWICL